MEIRKTIKSTIVYYYLAGLLFIGLVIASTYMSPAEVLDYSFLYFDRIIPLASIVLGFIAGGAKSYAKWGFPIYIALLTFCLEVFVFTVEDWRFIGMAFGLSLFGVIIRHVLKKPIKELKRIIKK